MQHELTEKQHQAIELLLSGSDMRCIAETLGIRRETLWRWRQLPLVQQAQREQWEIRRGQMRDSVAGVLQLALETVEKGLRDGCYGNYGLRVNTALRVLQMFQSSYVVTALPAPPENNHQP